MKKIFCFVLVCTFALLIQLHAPEAKADTWANLGTTYITYYNTDPGHETSISNSGSSFSISAGSSYSTDVNEASAEGTNSWQYQSSPGVQSTNTASFTANATLSSYSVYAATGGTFNGAAQLTIGGKGKFTSGTYYANSGGEPSYLGNFTVVSNYVMASVDLDGIALGYYAYMSATVYFY